MNDIATTRIENPFGEMTRGNAGAVAQAETGRAMQEVMGAMLIAQRVPRDQRRAMDRILQDLTLPIVAEGAQYAYPRGGQMVEGPSIRLAECIVRNWGNMQAGVRELSVELDPESGERVSVMEAFCWDLETNVSDRRTFRVPHRRDKRAGSETLTDGRDVYELTANMGARRKRACILAMIPASVVAAAVEQANATLRHTEEATSEAIDAMIERFGELGVSVQMLEARLRHDIRATVAAEMIGLRKIYTSLRDGMSKPGQWFEGYAEPAPADSNLAAELRASAASNAAAGKGSKKKRASKRAPKASQEPAEPPQQDQAPESAGERPPTQHGASDEAVEAAASEPDVLFLQICDRIDAAKSHENLEAVRGFWADFDDVKLSNDQTEELLERFDTKAEELKNQGSLL